MTETKSPETPFTCPHCGQTDKEFHQVCPLCGRRYFRDYVDTQMHPRDSNPTGIYSGKFWARVFLVLTLCGLALGILAFLGLFRMALP